MGWKQGDGSRLKRIEKTRLNILAQRGRGQGEVALAIVEQEPIGAMHISQDQIEVVIDVNKRG